MAKEGFGKERLLRLAEFLETKVPAAKFDYSMWAADDFTDHSCGSAGCALGWAACIPEFRKKGLKINKSNLGMTFISLEDKVVNYEAAANFFELSEDETFFLFSSSTWHKQKRSPGYRATPVQVAKHIREFLADHRAD